MLPPSLVTVKIAYRNLLLHKRKNLAVGLIIFFCVQVFFWSGEINKCSQASWNSFLGSTFVGHYNITTFDSSQIDHSYPPLEFPKKLISRAALENLDQHKISYQKKIRIGAAIYDERKSSFDGPQITLIGTNIKNELSLRNNLIIKSGGIENLKADSNEVVVWHEVNTKMNWAVGDEITLYVKDLGGKASYPYTFKIAAILDMKDNGLMTGNGMLLGYPLIYADITYLNRVLGLEDKIFEIAIENPLNNLSDNPELKTYTIFSAAESFGAIHGIVKFVKFIGTSMEILVLILLVLFVLNVFTMTFLDRQKEIGSILSIGASPVFIIKILLIEIALLSFISYLLSLTFYLIIACTFHTGINFHSAEILFAGKNLILSPLPETWWIAYIVTSVAGIVSIAYPCYLVLKLNPIDVFKDSNL